MRCAIVTFAAAAAVATPTAATTAAAAIAALGACGTPPSPSPPPSPSSHEGTAEPPPPASTPTACTPAWLALDSDDIVDLDLAGDELVWATRGRGAVMVTPRAGGPTRTLDAGGAEYEVAWGVIGELAQTAGRVYWTRPQDGTVLSAPLAGGATREEATGLESPGPIVEVDGAVAVGTRKGIFRIGDGGAPTKIYDGKAVELVRDGDDLYADAVKSIVRVPWRGGQSKQVTTYNGWLGAIESIVTYQDAVLFADVNMGILAAPMAGGEVSTLVDQRTSAMPAQLAVHDGALFFTMDDTLYMARGEQLYAVAVAAASISSFAVAGDTIYAAVGGAGIMRLCFDPASSEIVLSEPEFEPLTCPAGREYLKNSYDDGCLDTARSLGVPARSWYHSGVPSGEITEDAVSHAVYHDGGKRAETPLRSAGQTRRWYPDGTLSVEGEYDADGVKHGTWTYYAATGEVERVEVWDHATLVSTR